MSAAPSEQPPGLRPALRGWFTQKPRPHGEVDEERTVSFLELFYDLVFVVLIAQIAHTLADDVTWEGVADFAIVFGLIWIAWLNGSLYHEVHGREDGRSRSYIFIQMLLLVVLAVLAGHAVDEDGQQFAITYAALLAVLTYQWWVVRRHDSPEYSPLTTRYIGSLLVLIGVVVASAFVGEEIRVVMWAVLVVGWVIGVGAQTRTNRQALGGVRATESMAERFGLFTIIVLGEVVVGVVDGIAETDRGAEEIITGLLALSIGFGFWWNYFDLVGRRMPRMTSGNFTAWIVTHLPLTASIAAAGAGMVSLIEHATDDHTPSATAWLLSAFSALLLVGIAVLVRTIDYPPDIAAIIPRVITALLVGAAVSLVIGAAAPRAWVLALLLSLVQSAIWFYVFALRARQPAEAVSP